MFNFLQHFCVFEKEFLRLHEPAWIPINYGTRVQKESLKKFRKVIQFAKLYYKLVLRNTDDVFKYDPIRRIKC